MGIMRKPSVEVRKGLLIIRIFKTATQDNRRNNFWGLYVNNTLPSFFYSWEERQKGDQGKTILTIDSQASRINSKRECRRENACIL